MLPLRCLHELLHVLAHGEVTQQIFITHEEQFPKTYNRSGISGLGNAKNEANLQENGVELLQERLKKILR
jgi:hypothetical protein